MQELLWTVFLYSQLCHNVSWECCYPELGTVMLIGNTLICTIGVSFLGRRRRPYIVFRNRFLYGFMFVYVIYTSWLSGVLRVYTTRELRSEEVCSVYAPSRRRGAYTMQTSDDRGFEGRIYAQYTT